MADKKEAKVEEVKARDANLVSDSGRTTIVAEMGDEGAFTIIVERDGHNLFRHDMGREERPVDG